MTVYEYIRSLAFEDMVLFMYLNNQRRGLKKTREWLNSEYKEAGKDESN